MARHSVGPRRAAPVAAVAVFAVFAMLLVQAVDQYKTIKVFTTNEGVTSSQTFSVSSLAAECPGGVLSYSVSDAQGNTATFPNPHEPALQFTAPLTGMTTGSRVTHVDIAAMCNAVTAVGGTMHMYVRVLPSATTSTTSTTTTTTTTTQQPSTLTCKTPSAASVANGASATFPVSSFATGCAALTIEIADQSGTYFTTGMAGSAPVLIFNANNATAPAGNYSATLLVSCGSEACMSSQVVVVAALPTTTAPPMACPGNYEYTLMLNADGTFTEQAASLSDRAKASGTFCASGTITAVLSAPGSGSVRSDGTGTFFYTPNTPEAGSAVDSFGFQLTCSNQGTQCAGTAVISIAGQDDGAVYYARDGALVCRGTCDAAAWRTNPSAAGLFDVNTTGVAVTARQDGRAVDGIDFGFTIDGELLIHAYTSIGNLAARFVTFYPITKAAAAGTLDASAVPDGAHVCFEPTCLSKQASTGAGQDIWTWTNLNALTGHLNTQTNAYKSGDNYYQKFGGNHRQCDVYRTDPCKYAPLMTPTLNDDNHDVYNNATPSVQWKLYINGCDATWVGKASVESLRALRQPDGSPTFALESSGTYLVGTVYSQSVKPASWTSPSAGISHTETAYKLRLKINNMIVVEASAQPVDASVVPATSQLKMSSDIEFGTGERKVTAERLYYYSVLLYPYFATNSTAANITTQSLKVTATTLINSTWTSPSKVECPKCTGTLISCNGTGNGFETNCGDKALMSFEAIDYNESYFTSSGANGSTSGTAPSTVVSAKNALRVTFAVRANGAGSVHSADAYPVGTFAISVTLSNKQVFEVVVNQTDYISELNTRFVDTEVCRSSAYWPVPDPLGTSVPVAPYSAAALAFPAGTTTSKEEEEEEANTYYGAPERLTMAAVCATTPDFDSPHITLGSMSSTITNGMETVAVSMCAVVDEQTFGATDWLTISLPNIHEETKTINSEAISGIIDDPELENNAYTVAELQYLTLTVHASEVVSSVLAGADANGYVNILLDGGNAPKSERSEEETWMYPENGSSSTSSDAFLPWQMYASSLSYRRISLVQSAPSSDAVSEPFHFAFIPGSLLHSGSSIRVPLAIRAAIKFVTYAFTAANATHSSQRVKRGEREESLLYIVSVSRGISASLRFDTDTYNPVITQSGIAKKSATAILIVLFVAIVGVLAASVYVEVTYKRMIHNAKYHPKRPESAVGIRYGRDGKPKENQKTAKEGSRASPGTSQPASKTRGAAGAAAADPTTSSVKTKFGVVRGEQKRVPESEAGNSSAASEAGAAPKQDDGYVLENPPIGEEQPRVEDDEVAEF